VRGILRTAAVCTAVAIASLGLSVGPAAANSYSHSGNCTMWGGNDYPYDIAVGYQESSNCTDVQIGLRVLKNGTWSTYFRTEYDRTVSLSIGSATDFAYSLHNAKFNGVWGGLTLWCC